MEVFKWNIDWSLPSTAVFQLHELAAHDTSKHLDNYWLARCRSLQHCWHLVLWIGNSFFTHFFPQFFSSLKFGKQFVRSASHSNSSQQLKFFAFIFFCVSFFCETHRQKGKNGRLSATVQMKRTVLCYIAPSAGTEVHQYSAAITLPWIMFEFWICNASK